MHSIVLSIAVHVKTKNNNLKKSEKEENLVESLFVCIWSLTPAVEITIKRLFLRLVLLVIFLFFVKLPGPSTPLMCMFFIFTRF